MGNCDGCKYYKSRFSCIEEMTADALQCFQCIEASLAVMRNELAIMGDLCDLCKYAGSHTGSCQTDCMVCSDEVCVCKKCLNSAGKGGFELNGGKDDNI